MRAMWIAMGLGLGCGKSAEPGPTSQSGDSGTDPSTVDSAADSDPGETAETERAESCIAELSTRPGARMVTEAWLDIRLEESASVELLCTTAADPEEAHVLEAGAAVEHSLALRGLLAETTYVCSVRGGCAEGAEEIELRTGSLPESVGGYVASGSTDRMSGAYTLFNEAEVCDSGVDQIVLVDPQGRVRWYHIIPESLELDLDVSLAVEPRSGELGIYYGGGWGLFDTGVKTWGISRFLDLSGEEIYHRALPEHGLGFNHHSQLTSQGRYLSLTTTEHPDAEGEPMLGIAVEEYDPVAEELTWSWTSEAAVAAGVIGRTTAADGRLNANSISPVTDAQGEAFYISDYYLSSILRVDRATGEISWRLGPGGDFRLLDASGAELSEEDWFYSQHDPEFEGNRVLLHDNGTDRPISDSEKYSQVMELELDLEAMTATVLWTWTEEGWFEAVVGDSDRLENGNILVGRGHCDCCWWRGWKLPVGSNTAVIELDGETREVLWRLDWESADNGLYRAERVDGCALFANAAYCPDLAAER